MTSDRINKTADRPPGQQLVQAIAIVLLACGYSTVDAYEMEMGTVTVQDTFVIPGWTTVTFAQAFSVRPVVVSLPTNEGGDPASLRIRNVTTTGFDILQVEPNANDGPHLAMNTAYLAVEPGVHVLPDGNQLVAIEYNTSSVVQRFGGSNWDNVNFGNNFNRAPAVLANIQTLANEQQNPPNTSSVPFLEVALRNANRARVQVAIERAESTAGTVNFQERIGIVAIEDSVNFTFTDAFGNSVRMQSLLTPRNIQGWDDGCFANTYPVAFAASPLAVASVNSRAGNNGGWVRRCSAGAASLGLTVDEDIDNDSERSHINEEAGIIAASIAFHAVFGVDLRVSKGVSTLSDPFNGTVNPYSIPDASMRYVIGVENRGTTSPDTDSVVITDDMPANMALCVTATCLAGGPVILDTSGSPVPPGVSLGSVEYSDDGGATFAYIPIPDADGFDGNVDALQVSLDGQMAAIDLLGAPSFELIFAARID